MTAFVRQRGAQGHGFDVVHGFDWAAAPLLAGLARDPRGPARVLTLADPTRVGAVDAEVLAAFGVVGGGGASLLERGVRAADVCTASSPSLADSLRAHPDPDLAAAFAELGPRLVGIQEGVDYASCNPATDPALPSRYDAEDWSAKGTCRTALLRELELELDLDGPLLLVPGELTPERGAELLVQALPSLVRNELGLVIAGAASDRRVAEALRSARERFSDQLRWLEAPDARALRRLYAGADLVLAPAQSAAAAGKEHLWAQRYGAPPVVHGVGALRDGVLDCDAELATGTGFVFDEASKAALAGAVSRAVAAYHHPGWRRLVGRVMRLDLSWDRPARRYLQLYRQARAR